MFPLSRRQLLGHSSLLFCGYASSVQAAKFLPGARKLVAKPPLQQFSYDRVRLGESLLREQLDYQTRLFMGIDDDKLLKPFRQRAGQAAPGEDMGGWYDDSKDFHIDPNDWSTANWHGYIPGHSFGQYVSGLARAYAITGDEKIKQKVSGLVNKYALTISPRFFENYYLPAYTYDKLAIGLIDAYQYVGVEESKTALDKLTTAVLPFLPEKALTREERRARPYTQEAEIWDEPYTLPENLFIAWQLGMGERYKDLAARYLQNEAFFDPLAKGISPFKGKHAYSHVNALNSAIQAYFTNGESKYLKAARNGFAFIEAQSFATGGWGPNEELIAPDDTETLLQSLTETHRTFETPCGAYGHFKIARSLLQITKSSHYGDSMERILYNTILGAKPTLPDGSTFYYSDYNQKAHKFFRGEQWPCCSGTFIQLAADYGISTYVQEPERVYVNLYVPSQVRLDYGNHAVSIEQTTKYPFANTSSLKITADKPTRFSVSLRIPAWAGKATAISINGEPQPSEIKAGSFFDLSRTWKNGDLIEIILDMPMRLEALNSAHKDVVALLKGPLVLFPVDADAVNFTREQLLGATQVSDTSWKIKLGEKNIYLKPFIHIKDESYRLYNKILPKV
ncbi:hypothetical protein GCM10011613_21100 [Cellvibrio zantedeschiae]|uniref:Glycosyl hydrolase n=1 Tax=Cellvibrio zantedeschiae TaxID=1237077 RepID=A0ABQ3B4X9_9GAMM|nr:beta-L-arabinofuranosidase domain-containing protein [Cellvibrio zantedeschiae]GGY75369.1 hypothetical protein GCM10011613_21100 [Cellvibrio zantedeschiae]